MVCALWRFPALGIAACGGRLAGCWRRRGGLFRLALEGGLLQLLCLLFCRERRRDIALPLAIEELGILFVDVLLLFRGRIRAGDIEGPVLHEGEIRSPA